MKNTFLMLIALLCAAPLSAQQQWTLPGSGMVQIQSVVEAPNGFHYFGGFFTDSLFYDGQQALVSSGGQDAFLIKRHPSGQIAWALGFGSDQNDAIWDVACDTSGDIYLAGYAGGKFKLPLAQKDTILALPPQQSSAFGIRLNAQGEFQAAQLLEAVQGASNAGTVVAQAIQPSGKDKGFYLACLHYGEVLAPYANLFGAAQSLHIPGLSQHQESFILEIDSTQQPQLHLQLHGLQGQFIEDLALDSQNNLYVAGSFSDANAFDWQQPNHWVTPQDRDGFIACYNPDGQLHWMHSQTGAGFNSSTHLAIGQQQIYLAGIFDQELHSPQQAYASAGQEDVFLQAYDFNGNWQWTAVEGSAELDVVEGLSSWENTPALLLQTEGTLDNHSPLGISQVLLQSWTENGQKLTTEAFQSPLSVYGRGLSASQGHWNVWGIFEQQLQAPTGAHQSTAQAGFWHRWNICRPTSDSLSASICAGDSLLINGTWLSQAGHYQQRLQNRLGCDSTLYIQLEVRPLPQASLQSDGQELSLAPTDSNWTVEWFWNGQAVGQGLQWQPARAGDYWVLITDTNSCTYSSSPLLFLDSEERFEQPSAPRFFPNPNRGILYWNNWEQPAEALQLYDSGGRLLRTFRLQAGQRQLDLGELPNGIYHLSWAEKGQLHSWSINVQR